MGMDLKWLEKLETGAVTSRGVNAKAFGPAPDVSPDLALILAAVEQAGYGRALLEHEFHPVRKWRFDACWPDSGMVALERHGGTFVRVSCRCGVKYTQFKSRHHDKNGLEMDAEKSNAAVALGWAVIVATPRMLADGRALAALLATLERRSKRNHS